MREMQMTMTRRLNRPLSGSVSFGSLNMPADQELGSNERSYMIYTQADGREVKGRNLLLLYSPHISNLRLPICLSPTTTSISSTTPTPASPSSSITTPRPTSTTRVTSSPFPSSRRVSTGQLWFRVQNSLPAAAPDPQRNWFGLRTRGVI